MAHCKQKKNICNGFQVNAFMGIRDFTREKPFFAFFLLNSNFIKKINPCAWNYHAFAKVVLKFKNNLLDQFFGHSGLKGYKILLISKVF